MDYSQLSDADLDAAIAQAQAPQQAPQMQTASVDYSAMSDSDLESAIASLQGASKAPAIPQASDYVEPDQPDQPDMPPLLPGVTANQAQQQQNVIPDVAAGLYQGGLETVSHLGALGTPDAKSPLLNLLSLNREGLGDSAFGIQQYNPSNPQTYQTATSIGHGLPVPLGGGAAMAPTLLGKLGVSALEGMATSGLVEGGRQLSQGQFDPNAIANELALGGIGGALGQGIVSGVGAVGRKIFAPLTRPNNQVVAEVAQQVAPRDPMIPTRIPKRLKPSREVIREAEDAAVYDNFMRPVQPPEPPLSQAAQAGKTLAGGVTKEVQMSSLADDLETMAGAPGMTAGERRFEVKKNELAKEILGYARGNGGVPLEDLPAEILSDGERQTIRQFGEAKYFHKMAQEQLASFAQQLRARGRAEVRVGEFRYTIGQGKSEAALTRVGQKMKDEARFNLSDALEPPKAGGSRATVNEDAMEAILQKSPQPTGSDLEDANKLHHLVLAEQMWKQKAEASKKALGNTLKQVQERVQNLTKDPAHHLEISVQVGPGKIMLEHANERIEKSFLWQKWEKHIRKGTKKETPDQLKPIVMKEFFQNQARAMGRSPEDWIKIAEDAEMRYAEYERKLTDIVSKHGYLKPGATTVRKVLGISMMTLGSSIAAEGEAQATTEGETLVETRKRNSAVMRGFATEIGIGGALIAIGAMMVAGPKALSEPLARKVMLAGKRLGDTFDHIDALDKVLKGNLAQNMTKRSVKIIRSAWGVKFADEQLAARAKQELRAGITNGAFAKIQNPAEKKALQVYNDELQALKKDVAEHTRRANDWYKKQPEVIQKQYEYEMHHLSALNNSLNGSAPGDPLSGGISAAMDALFGQMNIKFQLLNLTDAFIAGGSRVGPYQVARAEAMLAADPTVKALYKNSGLVGGVKAVRQTVGAQAGSPVVDLSSKLPSVVPADEINANAVHLASMLNSFKKAKASGYAGTEQDFLKTVLQGKATKQVPQTMIDDAHLQAFDDILRTLSVDPLSLNKNFFTAMGPNAEKFAAFVNQPARVARLAGEYASNGETIKLQKLMLMTMLFGGSAVIPASVFTIWAQVDPEAAYATKATLNDGTIFQMLGYTARQAIPDQNFRKFSAAIQPDMSSKLGWDPMLYPLMGGFPAYSSFAGQNPALETATDAAQIGADIYSKMTAKKPDYFGAATKAMGAAAMVGLRPPGMPTALLNRTIKAGQQSASGEVPISYFNDKGKMFGQTQTLPLKQIPGGAAMPFIWQFLTPGESMLIAAQKQYQEEKSRRKRGVIFSQSPADTFGLHLRKKKR